MNNYVNPICWYWVPNPYVVDLNTVQACFIHQSWYGAQPVISEGLITPSEDLSIKKEEAQLALRDDSPSIREKEVDHLSLLNYEAKNDENHEIQNSGIKHLSDDDMVQKQLKSEHQEPYE